MKTVSTVPSIQQQPRTVADTAIHYGYIAYKDIFVGDRWVQPRHDTNQSPYWKEIPSRQLIPFSNIEVPEVIAEVTSVNAPIRVMHNQGKDITVRMVSRTAKECAQELESSYQEWGFVVLYPITGYTEQDAFAIFQVIQPFVYKLGDLRNELSLKALQRINATAPFTAHYGNESITLDPLPEELKETALKVLTMMQESVIRGESLANEVIAKTKQKMTQFYATGTGKQYADPHDAYVFDEMNDTIPELITSDAPKDNFDDIELRRREIELREKELEIRMRELALKEDPPTYNDPLAKARAAKAAKAAERAVA
jgi:hypothetical protein